MTPDDLIKLIIAIKEDTARINEKLTTLDDHDDRLRHLEKWRDQSTGKLAGIILATSVFAGALGFILKLII